MKKEQTLDFTSKFSEFAVVNSEFTKCKCYMLASGDNANGSDITDESIDKAIARGEFYNKPVVAHLFKDEETGKYRVGGHDSKWVISAEGIEIINECIPFGVIPESANIRKEVVMEPDGLTTNTYLVADILLWTGRYNIMDAAYSDDVYFGQSCELSVNEGHYKDNDIYSIDDFTFSALCLLNKDDNPDKNVRPCFPSCRVEKYKGFALHDNALMKEFDLLLERLYKYESDSSMSVSIHSKSTKEGEGSTMDNEKILAKLSEFKIAETETPKYALLGVDEATISVFDREDNKMYSVGCAIVDDEVVVDFEKKSEIFDLGAVVDSIKEDVKSEAEVAISAAYAESYNTKLQELTEKFENLSKNYDEAVAELEKFRAADKEMKALENKNKVNEVVAEFEDKMGRNSTFLIWKANLDYSKVTPDSVKTELIMMLGEIAAKGEMDKKAKTFSYQPVMSGVDTSASKAIYTDCDRYGDWLARVIRPE